MLTFIELSSFAAIRDKYLNDEEFMALQAYLTARTCEKTSTTDCSSA